MTPEQKAKYDAYRKSEAYKETKRKADKKYYAANAHKYYEWKQ